MMAIGTLAGCGGGDDNDSTNTSGVKVPLPAPAPVVTTPPATTTPDTTKPDTTTPDTTTPPGTTTPPVDTACNYTTTPGAAADTGAYVAATSEKANPNVIASAAIKPSVGGALQTKKINCMVTLTGADGKPIQLRGMSTGGLQWHGGSVNDNAFKALGKDWGANVVRLAMYVGEDGYATHPELYDKVTQGIDLAIANDLYVIVDWHVLTPGDPNAKIYEGALEFFTKIAAKYKNDKHIIYELANEPNPGTTAVPGVTNDAAGWAKVKSYAMPIINMLRASGNKNLVVVGTPNWSQRPDLAANDPIADDNVMYTVHFYSGTHKPSNVSTDRGNVMSNARYALEHGVGIFATEWGVSNADGSGGVFLNDADRWLDFLNKHNVSWANWQWDNSKETSAALASTTSLDPGSDLMWSASELSASGQYVRNRIKGTTAAVQTDPNAFSVVAADWNDGTIDGWGFSSTNTVTGITLSNEGNALKLSGMANSRGVGSGKDDFWGNIPIAGNSMAGHPDLAGAQTMTVDVIVDTPTTVAIAAVPQSKGNDWTSPARSVIATPANFVQANGKYKATLKFTHDDAPNLKMIAEDTNPTHGTTLTNIIMYVGVASGDSVSIDNLTFSGTRPAK